MSEALDGEEGGGKWAGITPSVIAREGALGGCQKMLGMEEEWIRVFWREKSLGDADKGGEWLYVSAHGILLEVMEMVAYNLLEAFADGMVSEDPIVVVGGEGRGEGRSVGDGPNMAEGPSIARNPQLREKVAIFEPPIPAEGGIIRTDAMETEKLGWSLYRKQGSFIQIIDYSSETIKSAACRLIRSIFP
eukprot:g46116.t1